MKGLFEVSSVEETWELARRFAQELSPGDVVWLEGDLGAGKTTFTQALAAAMESPGALRVPRSASFRNTPASGFWCIWISTCCMTKLMSRRSAGRIISHKVRFWSSNGPNAPVRLFRRTPGGWCSVILTARNAGRSNFCKRTDKWPRK